MKHNKFIVKFTIPNHLTREIFITFVTTICKDDDTPKDFFDTICTICIRETKKSHGIDLEPKDINFEMISLVDSVNVESL